nr:hypothetical protein [Tanacetum cinerariifolium]
MWFVNITKESEPFDETDKKEEVEDGTNDEPVRSVNGGLMREKVKELVEMPRLIDEELVGTDIRLSLASHSYVYPFGIAENVLVKIAGFIYPEDFVILDIKEDKRRPFILGTPFLTTAKAGIRFDKGVITLRSGKNRVNFHKIPEFLCKIEEEVENEIDPVTLTSTVSSLILEWEERIKLHQEKEMEFNQWRIKCLTMNVPHSGMKVVK